MSRRNDEGRVTDDDNEYWPVLPDVVVSVRRRRSAPDGRSSLVMGIDGGHGTADGLPFSFNYGLGGSLVVVFDGAPKGSDGSHGEYEINVRDVLPVLVKAERARRGGL